MDGRVPDEITRQPQFQGHLDQLDVHLSDKRSEIYTPPPAPAYVAFSGGSTLGSVNTTTGAAVFNESTANRNQPEMAVDKTIQLQVSQYILVNIWKQKNYFVVYIG